MPRAIAGRAGTDYPPELCAAERAPVPRDGSQFDAPMTLRVERGWTCGDRRLRGRPMWHLLPTDGCSRRSPAARVRRPAEPGRRCRGGGRVRPTSYCSRNPFEAFCGDASCRGGSIGRLAERMAPPMAVAWRCRCGRMAVAGSQVHDGIIVEGCGGERKAPHGNHYFPFRMVRSVDRPLRKASDHSAATARSLTARLVVPSISDAARRAEGARPRRSGVSRGDCFDRFFDDLPDGVGFQAASKKRMAHGPTISCRRYRCGETKADTSLAPSKPLLVAAF